MVYLRVLLVLSVLTSLTGCRSSSEGNEPSIPPPAPGAPVWFVDVAAQVGIEWRCAYGTDETDWILETTGPGPAWFDYDNDGDIDLFLLNGTHYDPDTLAKYQPRSAMYRNEGDGTFTDVTDRVGLGYVGWGGGSLAADFNRDGWVDLYIADANGPNALFINNGDGTFTNVTERAGVGDTLYGASACALDYNHDGWLDIYVANYVPFDKEVDELPGSSKFSIVRGVPMSLVPSGYPGVPDCLYRNNGDGTFTNVADEAGINDQLGRGLGCTPLDFDKDGWTDVYVGNDAMQNFLFHNNGDGTFTDVAGRMGCAYGEGGMPMGSMGIGAGDLDLDGWQDIVVANYEDQTASIYKNHKARFFRSMDISSGVGGPTLVPLVWGVVVADFDLNGMLDLIFAAGHVSSRLEVRYAYSTF